ncbi:hypothetical protein QTP88_009406 [Uroleucon formosanum]
MVESLIANKSNIDSNEHYEHNENQLSFTEDNISEQEENVSFTDDFYDEPDYECEKEEENCVEEFENVENVDITRVVGEVPGQMLTDAMDSFRERLHSCIAAQGRHMTDIIFKT